MWSDKELLINFGAIPLVNYLKKNVIEEKPFWVYNNLKNVKWRCGRDFGNQKI